MDAQTQNSVSSHSSFSVRYGFPEGQDARFLAERALEASRQKQIVVHIALDDVRLSALSELISFFAPDVEVLNFPAWDCLPYDRVSPHADIVAARVTALGRMLEWKEDGLYKPRIVLTTVGAAIQRVMATGSVASAQLVAKKGGCLKEQELFSFLAGNGYLRTDTVREAGEFAVRGGIIDIFPSGYEQPVRIDLFGDEVESIRSFDPSTQVTTGILERFELRPVTEFFLDEDSIARFRSGYRDLFGVTVANDPLYEAVSAGRKHAGMEHWLPLFHSKMATLFDYIAEPVVSFDAQAEQARAERLVQISDFYQARLTLDDSFKTKSKKKSDVSLTGVAYHPLPPEKLYLFEDEFLAAVSKFDPVVVQPFASHDDEEPIAKRVRDFVDIRALPDGNLFGEVGKYLTSLQQGGRKILVACYSQGSRDRMKVMMEEGGAGLPYPVDTWHQVTRLKPNQIGAVILPLEHGFIAEDLAVISEQDILGDRLSRKQGKRKKADNFLREVSSLAVGDLVVHVDHGVGRFEGLETLKAGGLLHDCLKITYAGGDRLFVPVENIDLLSRFGSEGAELDKLGGAGWQARKARVKKDLMVMAEGLLSIAAQRLLHHADRLEIDLGHYNEFVSRFPYQETEDQLRAIEDVLADIKSGKPMDRLVCGDVGFGKTEVALRAAYVAAMSGVQVAIVAPTTLLVRQHFANFRARFAEMGLRVEHLSRLVSARESKTVKEGLADGSVRVVIGTHALLAKDLKFANLGLVIVDEEQRFGVKQKERLKDLKNSVHVLTLSATPIPRTLQLALTGVRDMSLIATPPVDRLAIRTFVMPYDPLVIREAILREHYRGGQSFYVCPRIADMEELEQQLKELVPEVKVISAHGQMTPTDLEDRMNAFYDRQYDVLLATNIIESGLDIPSANTMIVHRADMFGLSQLYQIRGRVGRSKVRAYAYLTYPANIRLTEDAMKRLEIFETLDSLGAGFQLASHDLDIRGAGNLLGDAQSGHIREVGIELYQQMLEDAVAVVRTGEGHKVDVPDEWSPTLNLGMSVLIPENFVSDLSTRMSLYRRLGDLDSDEDIDSFGAEMIDRFGSLPEEVNNLLEIVRIKMYCKRAGIMQFDAGPKGAIIRFYKDQPPNPEKLFTWIAGKPGTVKVRPDQKISVLKSWDSLADRVKGARSLAFDLANCA
ncbi:MAG TPA: transcription-repair coupling factor [Alphaproteobacteria bacterium]|nr:transcription-repair coupling factor [Alphaproteobacteria bacterium]HNS43963.1 transcription-repair coupling factor [Alphaproteobacteria bacterium]